MDTQRNCLNSMMLSFLTRSSVRPLNFRGISEVWAPNTNLWIGETSSMYDGGAPHLSDTYVAGFM